MGGLGAMITDLATSQLECGASVSVILPFYKFLKDFDGFDETPSIVDSFQFDIHKMFAGGFWKSIFNALTLSFDHSVNVSVYQTRFNGIVLYLVSPGDIYPFTLAYQAASSHRSIYDVKYGLSHELQHLFYFKSVSYFIHQLARRNSLTVHLHGSTTSFAQLFFKAGKQRFKGENSNKWVSFVYTIHDYSFEFDYHVQKSSFRVFMEQNEFYSRIVDSLSLVDGKIYSSILGIYLSDAVSTVSSALLSEVESLHFINNEKWLKTLGVKSKKNPVYIISNGISSSRINPFEDEILVATNLCVQLPKNVFSTIFPLKKNQMCASNLGLTAQKLQSKNYIIQKGIIDFSVSLNTPILLFVGRFTAEKGIDYCIQAIETIKKKSAHLILMGQEIPNLFDMTLLRDLQIKHSKYLTIISSEQDQKTWGPIVRLAADFIFMPSKTESFGLVALEGLMFGCGIISSGVGGLGDFLVDKSQNEDRQASGWNAYLFSDYDSANMKIEMALDDLNQMKLDEYFLDKIRWTWLLNALNMGWKGKLKLKISSNDMGLELDTNDEIIAGGPVHQYFAVYINAAYKQRHVST